MLNIAARADGAASVAVPQVGGRHHALRKNLGRRIFTHLEFVAHHAHLAIEIFAGDPGVNHAVRLQFDGEVQILLSGGHGLVVIGAVVVGGSVEPGAVGS